MMLLPKFDFHAPGTLDEACRMMAEFGESARPLAGGTDLIVNMKKGLLSPDHLVSLSKIRDLKELDAADGTLRIGACVTAAELAAAGEIKERFEALSAGAGGLGSPLIRNLATLSGNLVSARPAADLPPSLMAYDARAVLNSSAGSREVPLNDFFKGPGETVIAPDEILSGIVLEKPEGAFGAAYVKLGVRKALEISLVNVAVFLTLENGDGPITTARVVLGSVAPTPIRSPSAEAVLKGERPTDALFERAAAAASKDSRPIDDFRASARYKRDMVAVLTRRMLTAALEAARSR